jgi:hypothetical protein
MSIGSSANAEAQQTVANNSNISADKRASRFGFFHAQLEIMTSLASTTAFKAIRHGRGVFISRACHTLRSKSHPFAIQRLQ